MLIAEVGCNHKGEMEIAHELIKMASVFCQVDVIKFQKRTNRELLSPQEYDRPHPNPHNSYGETYGQHRDFLEFDVNQHRQLKEWCEHFEVEYSTSVWDLTAAQEMVQLSPKLLKVPSACNVDFEMAGFLCDSFAGEIHVSMGMSTRAEESKIVEFYEKKGRGKDLVIYACTSGYPVPFEDLGLYEIRRLIEDYGTNVKAVGFSGHHLGIAADIAALALGATVFERHFTLDRTWRGTDHAASLEPDGMRRLARDLRSVGKGLTYKSEEILPIEKVQREKLKRKVNG
ncbi:N,N'-diacetyllegionaminic acid synthase [Novipirellula galeiformis]|uniref:N,N'-diacetyllegionaminic acid synthase n=1 Tax=Novipirellula galeiformis TaxID=2528004 RepID=A0A5C6CFT8_9BACT|nr:N-acetylneuraminate synthase family protein [Novipirellula galeiformis]TWU22915.1 N,N'-diacetyllegionaminic acid synthase [Novipirellula galeiformis]